MAQKESVKIIRLSSGEELLGFVTESSSSVVIRNPWILLPGENGQLQFTKWTPYSKDNKFFFYKEHVVFSTVPIYEIEQNYRSKTTGLFLPDASQQFNVRSEEE